MSGPLWPTIGGWVTSKKLASMRYPGRRCAPGAALSSVSLGGCRPGAETNV